MIWKGMTEITFTDVYTGSMHLTDTRWKGSEPMASRSHNDSLWKFQPDSCPNYLPSMLELDICAMNHPLAMSLMWLGIFQTFSHKLQLFDGLRCWQSWAFSDFTKSKNVSNQILQICGMSTQGIHPHLVASSFHCSCTQFPQEISAHQAGTLA